MNDRSSSIQVIDRMAQLLEAIAAQPKPLSLKYLAADTGLHPSTAFRILASLVQHGFVERDDSGAYRLGAKWLQFGSRVRARLDLREEALPIMEALRNQVDETVNLTVREGDEVVYVERALVKRMMRVEQVIGSRAPLHVTAVGKLMLAEDGEAACSAYAERSKLRRFTTHTLTTLPALLAEIREIKNAGYAFDNEEAELGVRCLGVLIRDASDAVVAGLSISAPQERLQATWVPLLQEAGMRLSKRLGYRTG